MIKTRQVTTTEEYAVCDFCGAEIKFDWYGNINETCSHCGKHICEKHWETECEIGAREDTWVLCPDCSKLVDIKYDETADVDEGEEPYMPIMKDTGKEMELSRW